MCDILFLVELTRSDTLVLSADGGGPMPEPSFNIGTLVVHSKKPEWGPGKIVRLSRDRVDVVWRDLPDRTVKRMIMRGGLLQRAPDQHDDILENLPALTEVSGHLQLPTERLTVQQAIHDFRKRFPMGFEDPSYIAAERDYQWAVHLQFIETLSSGQLEELLHRDLPELRARVLRCIQKAGLLFSIENAAFRDAMRDDASSRRLFETMSDLLNAPAVTEEVFTPYVNAVADLPADRSRVASWPVATLLPAMAQPDRHVLLKPERVRRAAERLAFELHYDTKPNWRTYDAMLRMTDIYRQKIARLKPRDMIDVQLFFYVTCGRYDSLAAADQ